MNKSLWGSIVIGYITSFIFFGATVLYDIWKENIFGCNLTAITVSMIFGGFILAFILSIILGIFIYKKKVSKMEGKE